MDPSGCLDGRILQRRFKIGPLLGQGSQGEVYRLFDQGLPHQQLVIKIFAPSHLPDQEQSQWTREIHYAIGFNHPGLLRIFDTGLLLPEKRPYTIAEYFQSKPLYYFFNKRMSVSQISQIASQLLSALAYLHRSGLLHMDTKPSNILVDKQGHSIHAKLIDYGSVQKISLGHQPLRGTLHYCSPSVLRGKMAREADDLYSLGVVLLQLLCGPPAFFESELETWIGTVRLGHHPFAAFDFSDCGVFAPFIKSLIFQKYSSAEQAEKDLDSMMLGHATAKSNAGRGELAFPKVGFPPNKVHKLLGGIESALSGSTHKKAILLHGPRGVGKSTFCRETVKSYAHTRGIPVETFSCIAQNSTLAVVRALSEYHNSMRAFSGLDPGLVTQALTSSEYRNEFYALACKYVKQMAAEHQNVILIFESVAPTDLSLFELLLKIGEFLNLHQLNVVMIILLDSDQKLSRARRNLLHQNCYLHHLLERFVSCFIPFSYWRGPVVHQYVNAVLGRFSGEHPNVFDSRQRSALNTPRSIRNFLETALLDGRLAYEANHWVFRRRQRPSVSLNSRKDFLRSVLPYLPQPIRIDSFAAIFDHNAHLLNAFVQLVQDRLLIKDEDRYFWIGPNYLPKASRSTLKNLLQLVQTDPIHLMPLCALFPTTRNAKKLLGFLQEIEGTDRYNPLERVIQILLRKLPHSGLSGQLYFHLGRILSFAGQIDIAERALLRAVKKLLPYEQHLRFLAYVELCNVASKRGRHEQVLKFLEMTRNCAFSSEQRSYLTLLGSLAAALVRGPVDFPNFPIEEQFKLIQNDALSGRFSLRYAQALLWAGRRKEALEWSEQAIHLLEKTSQIIRLARALRMKAKILRDRNQLVEALELLERSLFLLKGRASFPREELETLVSLFFLQKRLGKTDLLEGYLSRIFVILSELRDPRYTLLWTELLAFSWESRRPKEALRHFRIQERLARSMNSPKHLYIALINQAMLEDSLGHQERAQKAQKRAQWVFRQYGSQFPQRFLEYNRHSTQTAVAAPLARR